ncbi:allophanate hydrolase [Hydrogenovibrio marinus]|uniref:Allophanate hydrolase n=1 Tax=Hydrogenovibrio marinus TaxID=28885 RepID=A0A066ZX08_HYDMR|nr:allophanate hydrolase [Hydrogenovibrio marinus]KDN96804.1 allophanate hydrolase [Hydrogenovibrio marinus]BBN59061.1 allophanate hydrolase [Hydrogenovibrio marinus]
MSTKHNFDLRISSLRQAYADGELSPRELMTLLVEKAESYEDHNIFIHLLSDEELEPYLTRLEACDPSSHPLWGIPFVIKDNIDLAGVPTTAACPEYAYVPEASATVAQLLVDAGAIPLGKANMDQFATGLVGTRSPYGVCHNAFDFNMISGGSSSGSAVSVALNLCSFSLGTDTAGSGRVPAAFNNLIGLKPSKGLLSTKGVVPAVRSQDVVSVFALNSQDAYEVFEVAAQADAEDEFSRKEMDLMPPAWGARPVLGIPSSETISFAGDEQAEKHFYDSIAELKKQGYEVKEINFQPWLDTAKLLYEGAWVAERYVAIEAFMEEFENVMDPSVGAIIAGARKLSAADAYKGSYALQKAQALTASLWQDIDCMLTPTTPTIYSIEQMQSDPIKLNSVLGTYTNFMNLLDYAALAMPTGFREDGLPIGLTMFAPAGTDRLLMKLADKLHGHFVPTSGAKETPVTTTHSEFFANPHAIPLAVVGAHLTGFPLNGQLIERGAKLLQTTKTAPKYNFYELSERPILKPGLVKNEAAGVSIEVEVWAMPKQHLGSFLALIPSPLGLGKVELINGTQVVGFVCEPYGIEGAKSISLTGGWRNWMAVRTG